MGTQTALGRGKMTRGFDEQFFDHYGVNLPNGRKMGYTPRILRRETELVAKGVDFIQMNGGRQRPADLDRKHHAVLLHPDFIQNYVGGSKPLIAMNKEECRGCAQAYYYSRTGLGGPGVGFITSGAQEGRYENDPWAQDYTKCPDQYIWIEEMFGELAAANGTIYVGPYDGIGEVDPDGLGNAYSTADLRQAMRSPADAHAFWMRHESASYPYFKRQLWRYKPVVMNQYFRAADNMHNRHARMEITYILVALALIHVGADPAYGTPFTFLVKTEFTNYTTRFVRPLEGGGQLIWWDFTSYSHEAMLNLMHAAFKHFKLPFNWEDTGGFSSTTKFVPADVTREDGFPLVRTEGYNGPKYPYQVSPYEPGVTYQCLGSPSSGNDMYGVAAKWYEQEWQHVPLTDVPLAFSKPDGSYLEPSATFAHDCYQGNLPYVVGNESGNNYKLTIVDYVNVLVSTNTINVKFPSGRVVPVTYVTGGPESIIGTFN